jgi:integrase
MEARGLLDYKRHLEAQNLSVGTKAKYLDTVITFMRKLHHLNVFETDPTIIAGEKVSRFKDEKGHKVDGLTEDEVQRVADFIQSLPPRYARLRLFFCLLACQGLRQIEVVRLTVEDIKGESLLVHGKGKDGKVPVKLAPVTQLALEHYLEVSGIASGPLFPGDSKDLEGHITTMTIKREFQGYKNHNKTVLGVFDFLGIEKTVHGFRHYFITHALDQGLSTRDVAKLARVTEATVAIYDDKKNIEAEADALHESMSTLKVL